VNTVISLINKQRRNHMSNNINTSKVRGYRFNSLARFERLEIVAHDPGFHLIAASLPLDRSPET